MALKKPVRQNVSASDADALARKLADRPYGEEKKEEDVVARTTISLPKSLLIKLEDVALDNKRAGREPKSVSALIRLATEQYLDSH
ncbi:hypothetical protein CYR40_18320 [Chimaeribacter arupi]|uniref:CopG family transcriptional regulator n=2 Tax=Yersiniaceae TaxID=1903411 RepID=A0A2N5EKX2_9GAMM|nr:MULTISPECIES: hypothetical protein [Yersiniaceae]MBS0970708.1 hypothetical protein [Nissabacter archeti]MDV5142093.1 hypothetical protein [Chimaeribacter arupi]PLR29450.1 hypothetical protein CYR23_20505 [Chimaeribacter arupi]PLR43159.1 hypothetical protein CYR40_18320 [Chimaeribacter arupi]PLR47392.1 hypothetical protein CYR34_14685 [Chimaeribacter arupi]